MNNTDSVNDVAPRTSLGLTLILSALTGLMILPMCLAWLIGSACQGLAQAWMDGYKKTEKWGNEV